MIFHLVSRSEWEMSAGDWVAQQSDEGFVHCCDEFQIADVRASCFAVDEEILAFAFDPTKLEAETRYEPGSGGESERFPHVYGSLPRGSVAFVREL